MSFKSFLKQAAILPEPKKVAISDRFLDESGKPELWEIRAISEKENAAIKESCTSKSIFKGRQTTSFNGRMYSSRLCAACVVEPDLKNAELQASYGAVGEVELLDAMLISGEYATLTEEVQSINGFDLDKLVEDKAETKNS